MKKLFRIIIVGVMFLILLAPFAGVIYLASGNVPDFFGYGVGPVETFMMLGIILVLFKIAGGVMEFNMRLLDKIFGVLFKEHSHDISKQNKDISEL